MHVQGSIDDALHAEWSATCQNIIKGLDVRLSGDKTSMADTGFPIMSADYILKRKFFTGVTQQMRLHEIDRNVSMQLKLCKRDGRCNDCRRKSIGRFNSSAVMAWADSSEVQ